MTSAAIAGALALGVAVAIGLYGIILIARTAVLDFNGQLDMNAFPYYVTGCVLLGIATFLFALGR